MFNLVLVLLNLVVMLSVFALWMKFLNFKSKQKAQEDFHTAEIKSKLLILQDLTDKIEKKTRDSVELIEKKYKLLHKKTEVVDIQIKKLEHIKKKSLEVAEMFQDKLPYDEVIERKQTHKYIQAAQLARSGIKANEIARKLNLPKSEVDFICKVKNEKLDHDLNYVKENKLEKKQIEDLQYNFKQSFENLKSKMMD